MESNGISGYFFQANTSDGRTESTEIGLTQFFAQTDGFEDLCTTIRADGRDPHFTHDFKQAFADGFDIILFSSGIIQLNIPVFNQAVENSECHVRIQGTCSETQ